MKIALIILSITIIAVQAIPVPKEEDVYQLTSELYAKHTSGLGDFDLGEEEGDARVNSKGYYGRNKRSPVTQLDELTSELYAKHTSGSDHFDLGEEEGDARVNSKGYYGRNKRSPVAPLDELTSELYAKHTSGSDHFDLG